MFWILLAPYQRHCSQISFPTWLVAFLLCWWFLGLCRNFQLDVVSLICFIFFFPCLGGQSMKYSLRPRSIRKPLFSSVQFIVSGLIFRTLIHFELIVKYGDKQQSDSILSRVTSQCSRCHLLERFSLLRCRFLVPLSTSICSFTCHF